MSLALCSDIPARVLAVIAENQATELAIMDAQRGGDATPVITALFTGPWTSVDLFPSLYVDSTDREVLGWPPQPSMQGNFQYVLYVTVAIHVQTTGQDRNRMRDLAERYEGCCTRILLGKKDGLETVADPTRFCLGVQPDGRATWKDEVQGSGAIVRTARIPLKVWMEEAI